MVEDEEPTLGVSAEDRFPHRIESPTLELTHREAKTTFEYQVQRLREIDNKAIEILKANLLLIGIVVTGGSILIQTEFEISPFINVFTLLGGLLLLGSTGLAAVTYTASNLRGGVDRVAVETAIAVDKNPREGAEPSRTYSEQLLRSYARWIEYNARVTAVNDLLATVTVLLVFVAFVYVVAGVAVGVLGLSVFQSVIWFIVLSAGLFGFMWISYHMDHLGPERDEWPETFEGIRLSKGTSRKYAFRALLGMIGRKAPEEGDREQ